MQQSGRDNPDASTRVDCVDDDSLRSAAAVLCCAVYGVLRLAFGGGDGKYVSPGDMTLRAAGKKERRREGKRKGGAPATGALSLLVQGC
jgi:hypothetical protein